MEGIAELLPWSTLTPAGLLIMVGLFVFLGWLVPSKFYQEALKDRDHWRAAHSRSEKMREAAMVQVKVLLGAVDNMAGQKDLGASILESVKESGGGEGHDDL